ncbi:MAG: hypothetical protein AAGG02_18205 [Cyanobacteria bacterium P01_H01_bin.15]
MTTANPCSFQKRAVAATLAAAVTFVFGYGLTRLPLRTTAETLPSDAEVYLLSGDGQV